MVLFQTNECSNYPEVTHPTINEVLERRWQGCFLLNARKFFKKCLGWKNIELAATVWGNGISSNGFWRFGRYKNVRWITNHKKKNEWSGFYSSNVMVLVISEFKICKEREYLNLFHKP